MLNEVSAATPNDQFVLLNLINAQIFKPVVEFSDLSCGID